MADIDCPMCRGLTLEIPEGSCKLCGKIGTIPDRRKDSRALQHLLNCLNAVTCKHRHGQPISKRRLDDLSNAQVEYEQADHPEPMVPLRLVEELIVAYRDYSISLSGYGRKDIVEARKLLYAAIREVRE